MTIQKSIHGPALELEPLTAVVTAAGPIVAGDCIQLALNASTGVLTHTESATNDAQKHELIWAVCPVDAVSGDNVKVVLRGLVKARVRSQGTQVAAGERVNVIDAAAYTSAPLWSDGATGEKAVAIATVQGPASGGNVSTMYVIFNGIEGTGLV